ncbi:unnamed protein product, partial [Linum tenue]
MSHGCFEDFEPFMIAFENDVLGWATNKLSLKLLSFENDVLGYNYTLKF